MANSVKVELLSVSNCNRCVKLKTEIVKLIHEFNEPRLNYQELDLVEDLDYAVSLGVLTTPSIAIDGQLVFSGAPKIHELKQALIQALD